MPVATRGNPAEIPGFPEKPLDDIAPRIDHDISYQEATAPADRPGRDHVHAADGRHSPGNGTHITHPVGDHDTDPPRQPARTLATHRPCAARRRDGAHARSTNRCPILGPLSPAVIGVAIILTKSLKIPGKFSPQILLAPSKARLAAHRKAVMPSGTEIPSDGHQYPMLSWNAIVDYRQPTPARNPALSVEIMASAPSTSFVQHCLDPGAKHRQKLRLEPGMLLQPTGISPGRMWQRKDAWCVVSPVRDSIGHTDIGLQVPAMGKATDQQCQAHLAQMRHYPITPDTRADRRWRQIRPIVGIAREAERHRHHRDSASVIECGFIHAHPVPQSAPRRVVEWFPASMHPQARGLANHEKPRSPTKPDNRSRGMGGRGDGKTFAAHSAITYFLAQLRHVANPLPIQFAKRFRTNLTGCTETETPAACKQSPIRRTCNVGQSGAGIVSRNRPQLDECLGEFGDASGTEACCVGSWIADRPGICPIESKSRITGPIRLRQSRTAHIMRYDMLLDAEQGYQRRMPTDRIPGRLAALPTKQFRKEAIP